MQSDEHDVSQLQNCVHFPLTTRGLICSGAIRSVSQCKEWIKLAKALQPNVEWDKGLRISSLQLNIPKDEWSIIRQQHCLFATELSPSVSIAHLCLPTPRLLIKESMKQPVVQSRIFSRLLHQFNAEGWLTYCSWLSDDVAMVLEKIEPEASEEYTLQALLESFLHEVHSSILKRIRQDIQGALLEEAAIPHTGNKELLLTLEKRIVIGREKMEELLKTQENLLWDIKETIAKIDNHSELLDLKFKATLLHQLISGYQSDHNTPLTWQQNILLLQLLDKRLDIVSAVNCDTGLERSKFVFAMWLGIVKK